jgi:hypothetical protein
MAVEREVLIERTATDPFAGMRISWGGVFGGVLSGIGTLMLLTSLGLAIGISSVDPGNTEGSTVGTGAAIWGALTLLVALFVGGWASTRLSMLWEPTTAMFEGVLVWVLSLVLMLYLAASGISLVASGLFNLAGKSAQVAASATGSAVDEGAMGAGTVDEILARLRDPQTATTLASALRLPQDEVASVLSDTSTRVEAARADPAQAAAEVRTGLSSLTTRARANLSQAAEQMQPEATTTAWLTFGALLLSLLAAIAGAALGRRGVVRRVGP